MQIVALILTIAHTPAFADHTADHTSTNKPAKPELVLNSNRRGLYLAVGPVGVAARGQDNWDSGFGGELNVTWVREGSALTALGISLGAVALSERDGGRIWLGGLIGIDWLPGKLPLGLSIGTAIDVDGVRHPRFGGYATLWFYAGVMPFVRVSTIHKSGSGVELGLSIPLPILKL